MDLFEKHQRALITAFNEQYDRRAAAHRAIENLRTARNQALAELGKRPGWWRPFARRRWDLKRDTFGQYFAELALQLPFKHPSLLRVPFYAFETFAEQLS